MRPAAATSSVPSLRRSIHHIPPLSHDFKDGVPGLLSAGGFDMAWNQYMALMMEKLNNLTAGAFLPLPLSYTILSLPP